MLRTRVITALVLLLIVAGAVAAPSAWPMLALLALMCGAAWGEWLRLAGFSLRVAVACGVVALVLLLLASGLLLRDPQALAIFRRVILPLSVVFWLLVAPVAIVRARLPIRCQGAWLALPGVLVLAATWYALAWLFLARGAVGLISLWALVWCADMAAYFAGRSFGRHKLAPQVSPGKTREGAVGGIVAATVWLVATAGGLPGSYGELLLARVGWPGVVAAGVLLAAWSIVGDLFESLLKRRAGVKDSGNLLPGHGGVYDRVDAVLPVAPAAVLLLML